MTELGIGIVTGGPYQGEYYILVKGAVNFPRWRTVWLTEGDDEFGVQRDIPEKYLEAIC